MMFKNFYLILVLCFCSQIIPINSETENKPISIDSVPKYICADIIEIFAENFTKKYSSIDTYLATYNFCNLFGMFYIPKYSKEMLCSDNSKETCVVEHIAGLIETWNGEDTIESVLRLKLHISRVYPEYYKLFNDLMSYVIHYIK